MGALWRWCCMSPLSFRCTTVLLRKQAMAAELSTKSKCHEMLRNNQTRQPHGALINFLYSQEQMSSVAMPAHVAGATASNATHRMRPINGHQSSSLMKPRPWPSIGHQGHWHMAPFCGGQRQRNGGARLGTAHARAVLHLHARNHMRTRTATACARAHVHARPPGRGAGNGDGLRGH
jgi:hypothetical protein